MFRRFFIFLVCQLTATISVAQSIGKLDNTGCPGDVLCLSADTCKSLMQIDSLIMATDDAELKYSYTQRYMDMARQYGNDTILMTAYLYAGYSSHMVGKPLDAVSYTYKALMLADSLGRENVVTNCYLNLGCYYTDFNLEECLKYHNLGIDVAERTGNYADLELLYYNVAIFYLERKVYNMAVEYFEKAQTAYLKTGNVNPSSTAEYNFTIGINRLLYTLEKRDTARCVEMMDSLNMETGQVTNIETMEGLANVSMGLCDCNLLMAELGIVVQSAGYTNHAGDYLRILADVIERYNIQWLIPETYNTLYARYLLLMGDTGKVAALLDDSGSFNQDADRYYVRYLYNRRTARYRQALADLELYMREQHRVISVQSAANYADQAELMEYDRKMERLMEEKAQRTRAYQLAEKRNSIARWFAAAVLVIMLVIILQFLYSHHNSNVMRDALTSKHDELTEQNAMLNNLHEEILAQTEEIQLQKKIIEDQRDTLAEANRLLNYSINVGRDIQRALIWDEYLLRDMLGDSFVFWKPLHVVSGDFYWFTETGDRKFVLVADCTGHGVPGALLSMYGIAMMNDYVKRNSQLPASEILEMIKGAYIAQFVRGDRDFYDGMDCALMILNRREMTVEYSGARRPLIQIHDGEVITHRPDRISIGINPMREHCRFSNHVIPVHPGDMLYAFSDGISDQFGDEDGLTKFGTQQLIDILQEVSFLDTTIQKTIVESVVENWRTGAYYAGLSRTSVPQLDDQLLVGVRV